MAHDYCNDCRASRPGDLPKDAECKACPLRPTFVLDDDEVAAAKERLEAIAEVTASLRVRKRWESKLVCAQCRDVRCDAPDTGEPCRLAQRHHKVERVRVAGGAEHVVLACHRKACSSLWVVSLDSLGGPSLGGSAACNACGETAPIERRRPGRVRPDGTRVEYGEED